MNNRALKIKFLLLGVPALAGFAVLYLYPFARTLWYSALNNTFRKEFVFLDNYAAVIGNRYYRLALWNTFIFSVVGVVCLVALSLVLSFGIIRLSRRFAFTQNLIAAPMVLPTASVIFVWKAAFQNDWYGALMGYDALADFRTVLPLFLMYLWKNTGINVIILVAAAAGVPAGVREAALLDGAAGFRGFRLITLPLIAPNLMFVVVLSFVNALKNFRESYLFFGTNYPPDAAYTMQFYMNNQFQKLNYPNLTAGSVMFTVIIVAILLAAYRWENSYSGKIY
jgi:multiple sugar transport system permease protein